jgi:hypothetical protein
MNTKAKAEEMSFEDCDNILGSLTESPTLPQSGLEECINNNASTDAKPSYKDAMNLDDIIEKIEEKSNYEDGFVQQRSRKKEKKNDLTATVVTAEKKINVENKIVLIEKKPYMEPNSLKEYHHNGDVFKIERTGNIKAANFNRLVLAKIGSRTRLERDICVHGECKRTDQLRHAFIHTINFNNTIYVKVDDLETVCFSEDCNAKDINCVFKKKHIFSTEEKADEGRCKCHFHDPVNGKTCDYFMSDNGKTCCLYHPFINRHFEREGVMRTFDISQMTIGEASMFINKDTEDKESTIIPETSIVIDTAINENDSDAESENSSNSDNDDNDDREKLEKEIEQINTKIDETKLEKKTNERCLLVAIRKVGEFKEELSVHENEGNSIAENLAEQLEEIDIKGSEYSVSFKQDASIKSYVDKIKDALAKKEESINSARAELKKLENFAYDKKKIDKIKEVKDKLSKKETKINNIYNLNIIKNDKDIYDMMSTVARLDIKIEEISS